jgi:hypothetical protein
MSVRFCYVRTCYIGDFEFFKFINKNIGNLMVFIPPVIDALEQLNHHASTWRISQK